MNLEQRKRERNRRIALEAIQIAGAAAKVGLYIGTCIAVVRAVSVATDIAKSRLVIPGGEILTIPMVLALFLVGWAMRGDMEKSWRRYLREQRRRRKNDRRI